MKIPTFWKDVQSRYEDKKQDILSSLMKIEPYKTAVAEYEDVLDLIQSVHSKDLSIKCVAQKKFLVSYLPSNLPLVSLFEYVFLPSYFFKKTSVHIPSQLYEHVEDLLNALHIEDLFPNVSFPKFSKSLFTRVNEGAVDTVIYTGRYCNLEKVLPFYTNSEIFFNGAGINPFVIDDTANIELAVESLVRARVFNSGQDCAAPDIIYIHRSVYSKAISLLKTQLDSLQIGPLQNKSIDIGPVSTRSYEQAKSFLDEHNQNIIYSHHSLFENIVPPHIVEATDDEYIFTEFFSPIFYVSIYDNLSILKKRLDKFDDFQKYTMYCSYFGEKTSIELPGQVLYNISVLDYDDLSHAFGGFSKYTSFHRLDGKMYEKPINVFKELAERM